ncbi:hypothetical protein PV08_03584 [Exophiala spinifera]|uniref:Zn(2)-C6 fungal-type domain-containing protein n=1 Tax=Exophiala spinifera TaxID=91928 RepID=A0A0D2BL11_9EURO|nr:uncharacterized protein PV08_03584 [Exophiala spinifera]KIW19290.1 hypothetical protein PV08_03584 [Exophiala spinifera]
MFHFSGRGHEPSSDSTMPASRNQGSSGEKRQITRSRISYSCQTCRKRKVKCDKVHPVCGGCKKANEDCVYNEDTKPPIAALTETSDGSKKRRTTYERQTSTSNSSSSPPQDKSMPPPPQLKAIEEQLRRLTSMVDALRNSSSNDSDLRDLLTPVHSQSEHESDDASSRPDLSIGMFRSRNSGSPKDVNELNWPLSGLKLTNGNPKRAEDPFWIHISDELDQLNHMMRRANNCNVPTGVQNKQGDGPKPPASGLHASSIKDDFWEPMSFEKAAAVSRIDAYNPDSDCTMCQTVPFSKATLLHTIPIHCSHTTAYHHLFKAFPTRAQSNVLLRCWLSTVYPILPLHIPSDVLEKHEKLWNQIETAGLAQMQTQYPDLELYTIMYVIWYAGVLSLSRKGLQRWFPGLTRAELATKFHGGAVFTLRMGHFMRDVSLHKLAALVLMQSLPIAEEDPVQASLYTQLSVRLGLTMGLHREPTLFDLPVAEEGMRRRIWWQLVLLDTSLVISTGYPTLISENVSDTRINCEDKDAFAADDDEGISLEGGKKTKPFSWGEAHSTDENGNLTLHRTMCLVARAKSVHACALRAIIDTHLSTKTITHTDMQKLKRVMAETEEQINGIIAQIPAQGLPEMGFVPEGPNGKARQAYSLDCDSAMSSSVTDKDLAFYQNYVSDDKLATPLARYHRRKLAVFNKWARITLSMLNDKLHCVAYAPFLKNAKSKMWTVARQCALHVCHSFMRKFISLVEDPDLETFRWTWPAMYGPLHAGLIMLVDLFEKPDSVEAPRSRELIDKVFSLSDPQTGIVGGPNGVTIQRPLREGGVEPWDMLRGLRSAAWQRAGLDPNVLWTQEDQLKVGVATPLTDAQRIAQSLREDTVYENGNGQATLVNADEGNRTTDHGVRYMVKLAASEINGEEEPEGYPCSRALRNRFLRDIESGDRQARGLKLVRLEGQQKMPFPLSGFAEQCSQQAAQGHIPGSCSGIGNPVIRPTALGYHQCSTGLASSDKREDDGPTPTVQQDGHHNSHSDTRLPPIGEDTPQKSLLGEPTGHGLSAPVMQSSHGNHENEQTFNAHQETQNDVSVSSNADFGFDWARWDSVFGQYTGFTDMMEDVTLSWVE